MKLFVIISIALLFVLSLTLPTYAGTPCPDGSQGNCAPSGAHYNLNILGMKNSKDADMRNSDRHTIFVALNNTGGTSSKIYLTQGDFQVCDGNAFDPAYDCDGNQIGGGNNGAVFQLPCNTNLPASDGTITLYPCDGGATAAYEVWARALGSPKNDPSVTISTCATEVVDVNGSGTLTTLCSTENTVLVRNKGKQQFTNVTNELTSLCVSTDADPACESRYALFRDEFKDWFWDYANNGVKLAQLRFYLLSPIVVVP